MTKDDAEFFLFAFGGAALIVIGYQVVHFLKSGDWHPISVITALQYVKVQWAITPKEWLGLHKILDFLPLSLTLLFFAGLGSNHD